MRLILLQPDTYTARQSSIAWFNIISDIENGNVVKWVDNEVGWNAIANYQRLKIITLIFEFSYDKQEESRMLISQFYAGRCILSPSDRDRPADYCSVYESNAELLSL